MLWLHADYYAKLPALCMVRWCISCTIITFIACSDGMCVIYCQHAGLLK